MKPTPQQNARPWRNRRLIIRTTLVFCAVEIIYITLFGKDNSLNESIATGAFVLAGSVIGSYVFGATWDDKNFNGRSED